MKTRSWAKPRRVSRASVEAASAVPTAPAADSAGDPTAGAGRRPDPTRLVVGEAGAAFVSLAARVLHFSFEDVDADSANQEPMDAAGAI